jgi:hypothetical protein
VGFAIYVWLGVAAVRALFLVKRRDRLFGVGLAATLLVLFVHSLLYAGFFEDPLTWGVLGLAAGVLAAAPVPEVAEQPAERVATAAPELLAH